MCQQNYWENRYLKHGNSGKGSRGKLKKFKWSIIDKYIDQQTAVIDIGCGDMEFWKGKELHASSYTGIDISTTILSENKKKYPDWKFFVTNASNQLFISADNVLCLDLLFHIMDGQAFRNILANITCYAKKFIFIYTWVTNPLETITDNEYQYYRSLDDYFGIFRNFQLVELARSTIDEHGGMYVFERLS